MIFFHILLPYLMEMRIIVKKIRYYNMNTRMIGLPLPIILLIVAFAISIIATVLTSYVLVAVSGGVALIGITIFMFDEFIIAK